MQALTVQLSQLAPSLSPSLVASATSSSSSSVRGRSCCTSFSSPPLPPPQAASVSSSSWKQAEPVWRSPPTDHHCVRRRNVIRASTGESATTSTIRQPASSAAGEGGGGSAGEKKQVEIADRVKHITTIEQFDEALKSAKQKLVVVEYAATHSANSRRIYPSMVDMSKEFKGVVFLLVLGDESDETKELCERAGIQKVPHFVFYKNGEKIHEEEGITSDVLEGDVLYYGDNDAPIYQVTSKGEFELLLKEHASDHQLLVLDVGLKNCGPCAKIYPAFVTLSKRMAGNTVFARMHGDENVECVTLLKSMGVVEVPTFLFIRDGKPLGRYVGSGRGELVGEILRHNGIRVT